MTTYGEHPRAADLVDVKVTVPELPDVRPFWIRGCAAHQTFAELYQDCVNHTDVRRSQHALNRISRHFWYGDRLLLRGDSLHSLAPPASGGAAARPELSLALRRDLYRVGPREALDGHAEYTYVDAEDRIQKVIGIILNKAEKPGCFDLRDWRGRRLTSDKSLAFHALWPAWEDAEAFPDRARLRLRPRTGWLAYALLFLAALAGLGVGYWLWLTLAGRPVV